MSTRMVGWMAALAGLALVAGAEGPLPPRTLEDRVAALEKRVADLDARLAALQARLPEAAPVVVVADTPLRVETTTETFARVAKVLDGATVELGDGAVVRYIGVDPAANPREAHARNRALVEGRTVRLEFDVLRRDADNRLLAYVHVGRTFVNAELIRHGFARSAAAPPNARHATLFRDLETEARAARRGLWARVETDKD